MIENDDYSGNDPLFYIIAGEVSGDALGAGIMRSLKEKTLGKARFAGIGGSQMSSEGLISLFRMEELSVIGIVGVIPRIPKFLKMIKETVKDIFRKDPVALITIDSKGFTLRVAKQVHARQKTKQRKIKLLHMVAPTVWAWRPGRAKEISKYLDHLMALFPFEPEYFTCHGLKTTFIGHPANETKKANGSRFRKSFSIPNDVMVLSLLPGSRSSEVNMLLPVFEETILELRKTYSHVHSPYLLRAYVEIDTNLGWIEIVDFEELTSFYPGCETYEQGTYVGVIDKVTTFKEMLIDKFWDINYDRDANYSQGDDDDWENDFSIEKWNGDRDDYDVAYGAEVTNS